MNTSRIKLLLTTFSLFMSVSMASAITIDGNPIDWGPAGFLSGNWDYNYNIANNNATWVPNNEVKYMVEDNRNPNYPITSGDPSMIPYVGVHIRGIGSNYLFYDEPKVIHQDGSVVVEPFGYEPYDNEALYFQQDNDFVYILIVTSSLPDGQGDKGPGDIRININKTLDSGDGYPYEMGIKLGINGDLTQFGIYNVSEWSLGSNYVPANGPVQIKAGNKIGNATGAYVQCPTCNLNTGKDYNNPIYTIELRIPKSVLSDAGTNENTVNGNSDLKVANFDLSDFSINDNCTNDQISVPEFAIIALPIGALFGLVYLLIIRRKEH